MTAAGFLLRCYLVLGSLALAWVCRDSVILSSLFILQARVVRG